MAGTVKRVIIEAGQSIATPIGDMLTWENLYPHLAIRSPGTNSAYIPQWTQGSHSELYTIPGTFPGGPTVDALGVTVNGQYQKANLAGVAVEGVCMLTGFNPSGTFTTYDVFATHFPGTAEISGLVEDPTPSRFMTNHLAQPARVAKQVNNVWGTTFTTSTTHGWTGGELVTFKANTDALRSPIDGRRVYRIVTGASGSTFKIQPWPEFEQDVGADTGTGRTIAVNSGAGTFTRAAGSFLSDGFTVGATIASYGYANAGNNGQWTISTVTATVITVSSSAGMVTESGTGSNRIHEDGTANVSPTIVDSGVGNFEVDAAAKKFTRASGSWLTDGFAAGMVVTSEDFTNAGNNSQWTIASVTASDLVVTVGTGMVTETGGGGNERVHQDPRWEVRRCELGTITRKRTQTTHTAASGSPGSLGVGKVHISVNPPMIPAPVAGEQFDYQILAGDTAVSAHSTAGPICVRTRFGGLHDAGTDATVLIENARIRQPASGTSDTVKPPLRVTCERFPMRPGRVIQFQQKSFFVSTDGANDEVFTYDSALNPIDTGYHVDDTVVFAAGVVAVPAGLTAGTRYWVVGVDRKSPYAIRVSATKGGSPITPSAGTYYQVSVKPPDGIAFDTSYYVTRLASNVVPAVGEQLEMSFGYIDSGVGNFEVDAGATKFTRASGSWLTAGFSAGMDVTTEGFTNAGNNARWTIASVTDDDLVVIDGTGMVTETGGGGNERVYGEVMTYILAHGLVEHERVRLLQSVLAPTATMPPELQLDRYYYVKLVNSTTIQLTAEPGGAALTFTYTAGNSCIVERVEDMVSYHIAATPGGEELSCTSDGQDAFTVKMKRAERFAGCFSGMRMRCTSGANANQSVMLEHVEYDSANDLSLIHHTESWDNTPTDGDVFVIEPPPVNGTTVPFSKWFKRLPWSPLQGRGQGESVPLAGTIGYGSATLVPNAYGDYGVSAPGNAAVGEAIRIYSAGDWLPSRLIHGKTYYATAQINGAVYFSETLGGTNVQSPILTVSSVDSGAYTFTVTGHDLSENEPVQFVGDDLPSPIAASTRYYAKVVTADTFQVAATPGGAAVALVDAGSGTMTLEFPGSSATGYTETLNHEGRENPYPPGFSYPNQHSLNYHYNPFSGPKIAHSNGISAGISLAFKMNDHFGEEITLLNCAFGGTSLGHKEVMPSAGIGGFGAIDTREGASWSPEDRNGCYKRFLDMLDGLVIACDEEGVTGQVDVIYWNQGEEDQRFLALANQYGTNLKKLKAAMRQAIKDRGLFPGPASEIRWVQPIPRRDYGDYATTVEAAIKAEHDADPYARWVESNSTLDSLQDVNAYSSDDIHLAGSSMDTLAGWVFDAWKAMERTGTTAVQVCNLALANIGDSAAITSIDPVDGSHQSSVCSQYYGIALRKTLERHNWDFAQRRVSPTAVTTDRTEWLYSYTLPDDYRGVHAVLSKDATDDVSVNGVPTSIPYSVELDKNHKRRLYCNQEDVILRYYANVTDSTQWSESFVVAFAWTLASMIGPALIKGAKGVEIGKHAIQMAEFYMSQATHHDASTTRDKRNEDDVADWYR